LNQLLCLAANITPPKFWPLSAIGHWKLQLSKAKQDYVKAITSTKTGRSGRTLSSTSAVKVLSSGITKPRNNHTFSSLQAF